MQEFTGKVAVVTGVGSGIGRGLALRWAAEGMRVAMIDIDEAALQETAGLGGRVARRPAAGPPRRRDRGST